MDRNYVFQRIGITNLASGYLSMKSYQCTCRVYCEGAGSECRVHWEGLCPTCQFLWNGWSLSAVFGVGGVDVMFVRR